VRAPAARAGASMDREVIPSSRAQQLPCGDASEGEEVPPSRSPSWASNSSHIRPDGVARQRADAPPEAAEPPLPPTPSSGSGTGSPCRASRDSGGRYRPRSRGGPRQPAGRAGGSRPGPLAVKFDDLVLVNAPKQNRSPLVGGAVHRCRQLSIESWNGELDVEYRCLRTIALTVTITASNAQ
jgi:hypothetical protein